MDELVTRATPWSVAETVARFSDLLDEKGLKQFAVFDHSGEARKAGLELRDTQVVAFGNPVAGTPVMAAAPLAALDLPLKVLIWDDAGTTRLTYMAPSALAERYQLEPELAERVAGVPSLVDALLTPTPQ
jgi:uncharacterized protein (DUF302 family)